MEQPPRSSGANGFVISAVEGFVDGVAAADDVFEEETHLVTGFIGANEDRGEHVVLTEILGVIWDIELKVAVMLADPIFVLLGFESGVSDWVVGVLKSEGGVVFWIGKVLVEEPGAFVDVFITIVEEGNGWTLLDVLRSFAGIWNWGETDWEVAGDVVGGTTGGTNGHRADAAGEIFVGVFTGFDNAFGDD